MTARVAQIWRHPIKSHGREAIDRATLTVGQTLPWDRVWAVAHEGARLSGNDWAPCANFSRGAKAPSLMAIDAKFDAKTETLSLSHPDRPAISVHPDRDMGDLLDWLKPLMPQDRAQSANVIRVAQRGMTDTDFPSISIANMASNAAISKQLDQTIDPIRWRANIWIDGVKAWDEEAWIGRVLRIGTAEIEIREQITRCMATTANPATGVRDADTLGALKDRGHQEFGVYGVVTLTGEIAVGDVVDIR